MEVHHHHHHYHHEMEGGSLKSVGNAFKKAFSKSNMQHAGEAAIPAFTTALGGMAGGPLGAAAGAASGAMIDRAIDGDGLRKGTKKHIHYHRSRRQQARVDGDDKKYQHYKKKHAEAVEHYRTNPYHYLSKDKEHQKHLRKKRAALKEISKFADDSFGVGPEDIASGNGFYHNSSKQYSDSGYKAKVDTHMKKMHAAASPWIQHVKAYREAHHGITYSQALKEAAKTYRK
jgi:hypothetical protein